MKTINWDEVKPQEITLEDLENSVIKPYTYERGAWRCAQAMYKIYKQHPDYLDLDITARRPLEKGFDGDAISISLVCVPKLKMGIVYNIKHITNGAQNLTA